MASSFGSSAGESVSLEQLIALNDEIISLVRAGVPLELGLKELGGDESAALEQISTRLAERMNRGETLPMALAAEGDRFPRVYRVVVEAGLKSGRLSVALEAVSGFAWELLDLRRRIGLALLYPMIVFLLAYGLFFVFLLEMVHRFRDARLDFGLPMSTSLKVLGYLEETAGYWGWIPPVCVLLLVIWWMLNGGAQLLNFTGLSRPLGWIPGLKRIGTNYRSANFAELLGMLVEHEVPLPEGVVLAADATGDRPMQQSARAVAEATMQGRTLNQYSWEAQGFSPYLRWLLLRGQREAGLSQSLRLASDMYRRRAVNQTEWFKITFPIMAGLGIGGVTTFFYALAMFLPFIEMLRDLAIEEVVL